MDFLREKVAYLQGLAEGLGVDESTKEGKLLVNIIDVLEGFADVLTDVIDDQMDLEEYVNFLDEDLADVEEDIYGDDEDDYDDFDFDDYDDCCGDDECEFCGSFDDEDNEE